MTNDDGHVADEMRGPKKSSMKAPQHVIDLFESGQAHEARTEMAKVIEAQGESFNAEFIIGVDPVAGGDTMSLSDIGWPLGISTHVVFYIDKTTHGPCVIPRFLLTPGSYNENDIPTLNDEQMRRLTDSREALSFETMVDECQGTFNEEQMAALRRFLMRHADTLTSGGDGNIIIVRPLFDFGNADFRPPDPSAKPSAGLAWTPEDVDRTGFGPKLAEDKFFEAYVGKDTHIVPKFHIIRDLPERMEHDVYGPRDVPKLRTYLLEQWGPDKPFRKMALMQATMSPDFAHIPSNKRPDFVAGFVRTELELLRQANLWWVSDEMVDILTATAPAVPNDVTVNNLVLPSPAGLVVFQKAIEGIDAARPEASVTINAIAWGITDMAPTATRPREKVLSIACYRRIDFDEGLGSNDLQTAISTGLISEGRTGESKRIGNDLQVRIHGVTWAYIGRSDWPIGHDLNQMLPDTTHEQMLSFIEDRRLMAAFLTLIQQEAMADIEYQAIPRPERRRAERTGVHRDANDLRVVTLRRKHRNVIEEDDDTEPVDNTGRVYSHRWPVNPHYRWQRVGKGRQERRLTLVRGHIKGPEDKPLKVKQEVKAWVR